MRSQPPGRRACERGSPCRRLHKWAGRHWAASLASCSRHTSGRARAAAYAAMLARPAARPPRGTRGLFRAFNRWGEVVCSGVWVGWATRGSTLPPRCIERCYVIRNGGRYSENSTPPRRRSGKPEGKCRTLLLTLFHIFSPRPQGWEPDHEQAQEAADVGFEEASGHGR